MIRATKGKDTAFVRFRLSDGRDVQLFYKSPIVVNVDTWDAKRGEVSTRKLCPPAYRRKANAEINDTRERLLDAYEANRKYIHDSEDLAKVMRGEKLGAIETSDGGNVYDICECVTAYISTGRMTPRSAGYYVTLRAALKRFCLVAEADGKPNPFADIRTLCPHDVERFADFLRNEYRNVYKYPAIYEDRPDGTGRKGRKLCERSGNTLSWYLKELRAVLNFAERNGLVQRSPMVGLDIGREMYGTPYYLTREERNRLAAYDLTARPEFERVRDLFVFQCFCGCRIGDLLRLTRANVSGGYLEYMPTKTRRKRAETLRVPLHPTAKAIIRKYEAGGRLLPDCGDLTTINRNLRALFKHCGLCRMVSVLNPVTRQEEQKPLYEVASTHMARRTFVGLLYKQIKDPNIIGSMSGHAPNSRAFARYRNIDDEIKDEAIKLL